MIDQINREIIVSRFSNNIKLSYEIISNKKVLPSSYDIGIAFPQGKRVFVWFTIFQNKNVCCVLELNRSNTIGENVYFVNTYIPKDFELGTIVSAVLLENNLESESLKQIFLIDNMYSYKGIPICINYTPSYYKSKINLISNFLKQTDIESNKTSDIYFSVPVMWKHDHTNCKIDYFPKNLSIGYTIKCIQYMASTEILPLINIYFNKKPIRNTASFSNVTQFEYEQEIVPSYRLCTDRPVYKSKSFFWVKANISYDVYYLYAKQYKAGGTEKCLYAYAFVPNIKTSILLNSIFRKIKENTNLDYAEDSDSEDDFQDIREDKYVDLQTVVLMECEFNKIFKKWTPIRQIHSSRNEFQMVPYLDQLIVKKHI